MFSNPVNRTAHLSASRGFRVAPIAAFALLISLTCAGAGGPAVEAGDEILNPILTDADAITQGRRFYRARCIICHLKAGGKGPKIFRSDLTHEQFLEVVINGRATHTLRLDHPGRPATVELSAPVKIKRLDVRILEVAPGEHPALGIGEVELYARRR